MADQPRRASPELVAYMRETLMSGSDDDLDAFLSNYAVATIAEHLIDLLAPAARVTFFAAMRVKYPIEAGANGAHVSSEADDLLEPLREAIRSTWADHGVSPAGRRSVDVAIVQLAAGMVEEADGLLGHRTLQCVRDLVDSNWGRAPGFTPPGTKMRPGVIREAMETAYRRLDTILGPGRDLTMAVVQVVLGLAPTGVLADPTRRALGVFLISHWMYDCPLPEQRGGAVS